MKHRSRLLTGLLASVLTAASVFAAPSLKDVTDNYNTLSQDLLNNVGEIAAISNFVYQKDVATFTFEEGNIHLLRYVNGRPTTAIFVGKGHVDITVPLHSERQALWGVAKDSAVHESFETCFIRMADDLDLKLKEKFTFEQKSLDWKLFNTAKQSQGEQFFRPVTLHEYDNYFQLLRSTYERGPNGYFWVDFNRYTFSVDPNRPEGVRIAYEMKLGDIVVYEGAAFQQKERGITDDRAASEVDFPTTPLARSGTLRLGGSDGRDIDSADINFPILYNADSSGFVTIFLDHHFTPDRIDLNGKQIEFHQRRDFSAIGLILPEKAHKGDTLNVRIVYHGSTYDSAFPWVENPAATPYTLTFLIPKGYNYLMPNMSEKKEAGKYETFDVEVNKFNNFLFNSYATGFDTIPRISDAGLTVNFLKSKFINKRNFDCFVPDDLYQEGVLNSFDYLSSALGTPPDVFTVYVFPVNDLSMPGMMGVKQAACVNEGSNLAMGGFYMLAGTAAGKQWFGAALEPQSRHESWFGKSSPEYLGMMAIQNKVGAGQFYSNLVNRRDSVFRVAGFDQDMPLSAGERCDETTLRNKGIWLLHMLRFMMYDFEGGADQKFLRMMSELSNSANSKSYSNEDLQKAFERGTGSSLSAFFDQWVYGRRYPEFTVTYSFVNKADGWYVEGSVAQSGMGESFDQPVVCRVQTADDNNLFVRQEVKGTNTPFSLGPLTAEPKEFVFNEFMSVLSKDKVSKK